MKRVANHHKKLPTRDVKTKRGDRDPRRNNIAPNKSFKDFAPAKVWVAPAMPIVPKPPKFIGKAKVLEMVGKT